MKHWMLSSFFGSVCFILFVFPASGGGLAGAPVRKDVTLPSGKILHDAYILDSKPNGITVAYREGCSFFPFSDMSPELRQKFHYDPIKAAAYEKKRKEQKVLAEKLDAERKERDARALKEAKQRQLGLQIAAQQTYVRKLELRLEEAIRRRDTMESHIEQNRYAAVSIASVGSSGISVSSPWGFGGRIQTRVHNGMLSRLNTQEDSLTIKRDNLAQDIIDLQLQVESARRALALMVEKDKRGKK